MLTYPDGSTAEMFDRGVDDEGLPGLILGLRENMDLLVSAGVDVIHAQSDAALVLRENGELKWRPFPGNSLTLAGRSEDPDRERAEVMSAWRSRRPVMPPPFDYYCSMDPIDVGDIVLHTPDDRGAGVLAKSFCGQFSCCRVANLCSRLYCGVGGRQPVSVYRAR